MSGRPRLVDTFVLVGISIENASPSQCEVRGGLQKNLKNNSYIQLRDIDVKNAFPEGFLMRVSATPISRWHLFAIPDALKSLNSLHFIRKTYYNLIWLGKFQENKRLHLEVGVALTLIINASGNEFITSISLNCI